MQVIVCVDNRGGMMFNHRRQSRDVKVIEDIMDLTRGHVLWMNDYSKGLFEIDTDVRVSEDFLEDAGDEDFCFVENCPVSDGLAMNRLIVYCWNRDYPSDMKLDIDLSQWICQETIEFPGHSHDEITRKIYIKEC